MKVVSGITEYEDIEKNIASDIVNTSTEIKQASKAMRDSLITETGDYSIFAKTKFHTNKLKNLFIKLDDTITLEFLYKSGKQNYYEIFIPKDSLFQKEMFEDISR
jgi:hypothetical protein